MRKFIFITKRKRHMVNIFPYARNLGRFRVDYLAVRKISCNFAPAFCGVVPMM
ncbi:hypothetical protein HMPREF1870_01453 [Bacteroidales bacterium KA00344]|nr:hypothetical protein HMPREF1870_01453 [Bacteroidales bacterium KA00344]